METKLEKTQQFEFDAQMQEINVLAAAKSNPYHYVGKMHNDALAYIVDKVKKPDAKLLIKHALEYQALADKGFIKTFDDVFVDTLALQTDRLLSHIQKNDGVTLGILDILTLDEEVKDKLFWLIFTILNFDQNNQSIIETLERLSSWEFRISHSKLMIEQQQVLLSASAIARYSLDYWTENLQLEAKANRKKKCLRAIFTVCADVIGGVAGAVAGTTVGGPVGGVIGAAAVGSAMSGGANLIFRD
ncbi:hypothetical protein [Pontimicrobium sp. MEBiC06410]